MSALRRLLGILLFIYSKMPRYIMKDDPIKTAAIIASLESAGINVNGGDFCNAICSAKSLDFFDTLSNKLVLVTESLKSQFEDLKKAAYGRIRNGAVLASIIAPSPPIGVKYEYVEYVKRYGPPTNCIFDQALLFAIRLELGIPTG